MTATKMTMATAINTALADAMSADDSVVVFGEDVGRLGGVFRVTDGLTDKFGAQRCFDTPLAESGIVGMAIGMAMNGMRPVVEMQFDAFADPVIFLEPKKLYFAKDEVDVDLGVPEVGRAVVRRVGGDATLIAYGPSVGVALAAADQAAAAGRELCVVDVRSLVPFDDDTVTEAVRATGRAVVVAEAAGFASVASEIAARVGEQCFHHLEAPVRRVTGFDIPYPPPKLEHYHLPSIDRILDAVDSLQWDMA